MYGVKYDREDVWTCLLYTSHELRGEVVLAAVAAEDGKILDQIHPFFPTYLMRKEREWGLFVRRRARNGRTEPSAPLQTLRRKKNPPGETGGKGGSLILLM